MTETYFGILFFVIAFLLPLLWGILAVDRLTRSMFVLLGIVLPLSLVALTVISRHWNSLDLVTALALTFSWWGWIWWIALWQRKRRAHS